VTHELPEWLIDRMAAAIGIALGYDTRIPRVDRAAQAVARVLIHEGDIENYAYTDGPQQGLRLPLASLTGQADEA
jgi:hypothetical protein